MSKVLQVVNLSMKFDDQEIFKKLNFSLETGSMTALLGPNGAGKTTLVRILIGMLRSALKLRLVRQPEQLQKRFATLKKAYDCLNRPKKRSHKNLNR